MGHQRNDQGSEHEAPVREIAVNSYTFIASLGELEDVIARVRQIGQDYIDAKGSATIEVSKTVDPIGKQARKFLRDVVMGQIAEQASALVDGKMMRYPKAIWFEYYRQRFLGSEVDEGPHGTLIDVRTSSEEIGPAAYARFTDQVIDAAIAEEGVEFHFTREDHDQWRKTTKK